MRWLSSPADADATLLAALTACWTRVSDAGGAVGFPCVPVPPDEVAVATRDLVAALHDGQRLLVAEVDGVLAGWLVLVENAAPLTRHWARLLRVQTGLPFRGQGIGAALVLEGARAARARGLEQLHIEVRSGLGLEDFYGKLGWQVVGRWPSALRLPDGDRDELLMLLRLGTQGDALARP